jgi:hypothetical protein
VWNISTTRHLRRTVTSIGLAGLALAGCAWSAHPALAAGVAASPYHRIELSTLARGNGGTFPSGAFDFRWAVAASPGLLGDRPRRDQILLRGAGGQQCRSIHLQFAAGGQAQSAGLVLFRSGRAPVASDQVSDTKGALDATLSPGRAWTLAGRTPAISISVYVNGWAVCRSGRAIAAAPGRN